MRARATGGRRATIAVLLATVCGCTPGLAGGILDEFASTFGDVVVVPASDGTPPRATLTIPDLGSGEIVLEPGGTPVTVPVTPADDGFFIVAAGEDPEGIQEVRLVGEVRVQCTDGRGLGSLRIFTILLSDRDDSVPGGTALTRRWIPMAILLDQWRCAPETPQLVSVRMVLRAVARNFGGLESQTPSATFVYEP